MAFCLNMLIIAEFGSGQSFIVMVVNRKVSDCQITSHISSRENSRCSKGGLAHLRGLAVGQTKRKPSTRHRGREGEAEEGKGEKGECTKFMTEQREGFRLKSGGAYSCFISTDLLRMLSPSSGLSRPWGSVFLKDSQWYQIMWDTVQSHKSRTAQMCQ